MLLFVFQNETFARISDDFKNNAEYIINYKDSDVVIDPSRVSAEKVKDLDSRLIGLKFSVNFHLNSLEYEIKKMLFQNRCPIILESELT